MERTPFSRPTSASEQHYSQHPEDPTTIARQVVVVNAVDTDSITMLLKAFEDYRSCGRVHFILILDDYSLHLIVHLSVREE
jgi:hypothetical protein